MIDPNELKTALDMLDKADATQWEKNGEPKLEVVQLLMGNTAVTREDINAVLNKAIEAGKAKAAAANKEGTGIAPAAPDVAAPATAAPSEGTGIAPAVAPVQAAPTDQDKADNTGPGGPTATQPDGEEDKATRMAREVGEMKAVREPMVRLLNQLQVQRTALDEAIAQEQRKVDELDTKIEANTVQITDAEMVKRIQAQTQARLTQQAQATAKVADAMKLTGAKTYASPLDAALAAGAKRSTVLVNGVAVLAPHPRSQEGIRNMANWIHHNGSERAV